MEEFHDHTPEFRTEQESLQSIIKRLGNSVSPVMLDSNCRIFSVPEIDGILGYQLINNCAVVLGDPICLPHHQIKLINTFQSFCTKKGWKTVVFLATSKFAHETLNHGFKTLLECSVEADLNPQLFQIKDKLRWHLNHSQRLGVEVKECEYLDKEFEEKIKETINTWQNTKKGPRIHLGNFPSLENKRIFYAVKDEKIVGLLTLARLDHFQGWVITAYFATKEAPSGVTESLICSAAEVLAKEDCTFLCLGIVPKPVLGEMIGISPFSIFLVNAIYRIVRWLFPLDSKMAYFHKYRPNLSPMYILFSGKLNLNELLAIKQILNVKL